MEEATRHFVEGRFEEALKAFDESLAQLSGDNVNEQKAVIHANRGAAKMSLGDVEGAVACFDEALKCDGGHLESLHNKGVALSELQRFQEALECFEKVCDKAPEFFAGQCGKSEALASLGRFDESLGAAEKAVKIEPDNLTGHCDKAFALLKLKRYGESCASYAEAVRCGDDSAETKRLYSIVLAQHALEREDKGEKEEALKLLSKSTDLFPTPQNFHNQGIILVSMDRLDESMKRFEKALEVDESYYESHAALGVLLAQKDKIVESTEHLERACELDPKSIETRYNLGVMRIKAGNVEGARKEWLTVLEIEPGEPHATEALRILDAALAEAKAKGSDGKAETKAAAQKISDLSPATQSSAESASSSSDSKEYAKLTVDANGKGGGLTGEQADKLLSKLDKIDSALGGGGGARRKSVLERPAAPAAAGEGDRSFVRDVSSVQLRKAAPRDNFGGLEAKLTSALSKLELGPDAVERRKSYSLGPRVPGTVLPERPKVEYKQPGELFLPYADLKNKIPDGVDPSQKEEYLGDEEFKKLFGKNKEEFRAFPMWKKIREKKRLGLF